MKNKFGKLMLSLGTGLFTFFAFSISASACGYMAYQPEEPKCLRDE